MYCTSVKLWLQYGLLPELIKLCVLLLTRHRARDQGELPHSSVETDDGGIEQGGVCTDMQRGLRQSKQAIHNLKSPNICTPLSVFTFHTANPATKLSMHCAAGDSDAVSVPRV
jgi:hypothetical protein